MTAILKEWFGGVVIPKDDQGGFGLVETMAAVAILGIAGVSMVTALSSGTIAVDKGVREATAQSLVQSQLEYIKSYTYDSEATTYPLVFAPEGYALSVEVSSIPDTNTDIQKIMVTVLRGEEEVLQVENYKVNR